MQEKNLNLIPSGDMPVIYASQYDKNRVIRFNLFEGEDEYTLTGTEIVKCNIRKNDEHIVVITPTIGTNKYIDIYLPQQACACFGSNIGEITISSDEDTLIGTINFILEVERNPIQGGVTSETDIDDLTGQIEDIVYEVMSDDYYTKSEVDAALNLKANAADVYTKSEVDTALGLKADKSTTYTKTEVDTALALKADSSSVYTKAEVDTALALKANASDVYTKTEVDEIIEGLYPVNTASGSIATFTTSLALPLVAMSAEIVAQQASGTPTPSSPLPISGVSSVNLYQRGANLWDEEWELGTIDNVTGENIADSTKIRSKSYIAIKENENLYFYNGGNYTIGLRFYDNSKTFINSTAISLSTVLVYGTPQLPTNTKYIRFVVIAQTTYNNNISLNYPSTDTSYRAYNGETKTIALPETIYGGVLDVTRGKLSATWTNAVDLGSLGWFYDSAQQLFVTTDFVGYKNGTPFLCDVYSDNGAVSVSQLTKYGGTLRGNALYIKNTDYSSASTFKTAMSGKYITAALATPIDIDLTPEVISALVGTNNIFADSGDISVSFKQGIQEYIDDKTGG